MREMKWPLAGSNPEPLGHEPRVLPPEQASHMSVEESVSSESGKQTLLASAPFDGDLRSRCFDIIPFVCLFVCLFVCFCLFVCHFEIQNFVILFEYRKKKTESLVESI